MERGPEGVIGAVRRLLDDATEFAENDRTRENVESALELLDAMETGEGVPNGAVDRTNPFTGERP